MGILVHMHITFTLGEGSKTSVLMHRKQIIHSVERLELTILHKLSMFVVRFFSIISLALLKAMGAEMQHL